MLSFQEEKRLREKLSRGQDERPAVQVSLLTVNIWQIYMKIQIQTQSTSEHCGLYEALHFCE